MIDSVYLVFIVAIAAILFPYEALFVLLAVLGILFAGALMFSIRESLLSAFSSPSTHLLTRLRWIQNYGGSGVTRGRRLRLAERLIAHYQLDPVLQAIADPDAQWNQCVPVEMLMNDVYRINRRTYPLIGPKLSPAFLANVLTAARPHGSESQLTLNALLAFSDPSPYRSTRRKRIAMAINRAISGVILRRSINEMVDALNEGMRVFTSGSVQSHGEIWERTDFKEFRPAVYAERLLRGAELPREITEIRHLPLRQQRLLIGIRQIVVSGDTGAAFAKSLLLAPSCWLLFVKLRKERLAHEQWLQDKRVEDVMARRREAAQNAAREAEALANQARSLEDIMAERRRPAILLARTWPIGARAPGRSRFGGLPCLPIDIPWPRHFELDTPLHFLAQIDCRELPDLGGASPLPRDGDLLFFADVDEELIWESEATSRVVFVPASARVEEERALPPDIPRIDWNHANPDAGRSPIKTYAFPKWPIRAHPFESYLIDELLRNSGVEPKPITEQDRAALSAAMEEQARRILNDNPSSAAQYIARSEIAVDPSTGETQHDADGNVIFRGLFNPESHGPGFPFCGAVINTFLLHLHETARETVEDSEQTLKYFDRETTEANPTRVAAAEARIELTRQFSLKLELLSSRLGQMADDDLAGERENSILSEWVLDLFNEDLSRRTANYVRLVDQALREALKHASRRAVTEPRIRALMPQEAHLFNEHWLQQRWDGSTHMMLGATYTTSGRGGGVRLLRLDDDYGLGFGFSGTCAVEFWIDHASLAKQNFEGVYAQLAGI